jgi:hypothetical protein
MDRQMPVMDGYAAASRIRAWESDQQREPVPILALTAFAAAADAARAIEAGCNAHLTKPIRKETLLENIRKFSAGKKVLGQTAIRVDPRLRDILPAYLERRRADVPTLSDAIAHRRFEEAGKIGHKMKGSGAGYGLDRLTDIGAGIEKAAAEENVRMLTEQCRALADFLDTVIIVHD